MGDKFEFIRQDVDGLKESGLFISLRIMGSAADAWMTVDGRKVLNFCTNNYLGLANHPRMKAAAQEAVEKWGVGPAAVRSIAGTQGLHVELGKAVAEAGVDLLLTVGAPARVTAHAAQAAQPDLRAECFDDTACLCDKLAQFVAPRDIILVKGSRTARLETVIDGLKRIMDDRSRAALPIINHQ